MVPASGPSEDGLWQELPIAPDTGLNRYTENASPFLKTDSLGGTEGSNPSPSSGESDANLTFEGASPDAAHHQLLLGKADDGVRVRLTARRDATLH